MTDKGKVALEFNLRSRALGIHFDTQDLHLVAVRNSIKQLNYKGYQCLPHYKSHTDEQIQDFIEEFQARNGIKRADAVLMLPRSEVVTQMVEFPLEAANNLEEVMEYQLVNYFAVDLDECDFFPQIVGRSDTLKVMIVAIKKALLGQAFGCIRRWNLSLTGLSIDSFGLVNGLARLEPERVANSQIMVFRSFPEGLEMIGLRENRLVLSHYIPLPAEDLEDETKGERLNTAVEDGFSMARMEPNEVDHYLWVGSSQQGIRAYLSEEADIPFQSWVDDTGEVIEEAAMTGFGGAITAVHDHVLLKLNMLPEKQRKRHKRAPVMLALASLCLMVMVFVSHEVKGYTAMREQHSLLETRIGEQQVLMAEVAGARTELENRTTELELYKKFQTNRMLLRVLEAMSRDLPEDTYLTSMIIKKSIEVTIQGESEDPFNVQKVLTRMPFLTDVKPSNAITQGRNKDGKRRFMYKAKIKLEALN